jgi:hypothetical protein
MVVIRNNAIGIKKDGKRMIYVPYPRRKELIFATRRDLLTGLGGVQKCKERLQQSYFWLNMGKVILHIQRSV